jgi:hypothetical protein
MAKKREPEAAVTVEPLIIAGKETDFLALWGAIGDAEAERKIGQGGQLDTVFFKDVAKRCSPIIGEPLDEHDACDLYTVAYDYYANLKKKRESRRKWLFGTA